MKRVARIILTVIIILVVCCLVIRKDNPNTDLTINSSDVKKNPDAIELDLDYPTPKTKTINGTDYLESQLPVGKFGGEFISSTIGEGPKTFNPFTSTDATSSTMADAMYDGLFTSNPMTGEVIPKLAKNLEIKGNKYIIDD